MKIEKYIDHTNLKMEAGKQDIVKLCEEAKKYNFKTVCVNPYYVSFAKSLLTDTEVEVCTVIGFPLGMNTTACKVYEAKDAIKNGADEIDMVINVGALKDKEYDYVKEEIVKIKESIEDKLLKVIVETSLLTEDEIIMMTKICSEAKVHFIKTNTGFGKRGVTVDDVKIMNAHKSKSLEIKASGGIKNYEQAKELIDYGATRLGTSSGVLIVKGSKCNCEGCNCSK